MATKYYNSYGGRELWFNLSKDGILSPDETCDFTGICVGCMTTTTVRITFDDSQGQLPKVAIFSSPLGFEYAPMIIKRGKVTSCEIPFEALAKSHFGVRVAFLKEKADHSKQAGDIVYSTKCIVPLERKGD